MGWFGKGNPLISRKSRYLGGWNIISFGQIWCILGNQTCLPNQFSHFPRHLWGKTQPLFGELFYRTMRKMIHMIQSVGRDDSNWCLVISGRHETGGLSKPTSINLFGDPEWCRGYLSKNTSEVGEWEDPFHGLSQAAKFICSHHIYIYTCM